MWQIKDAVFQLPGDKNSESSFSYGFLENQKYMLKTRLSSSGHPSYFADNFLFGPLGTETEVHPNTTTRLPVYILL